uniref:FtsJ RNA 2'-O-methyltransferase 1 n=1 Tax=Oncorhynchus kisutch TaxID=8019 RepID=A0A8C7LLQ7_ONCKI
MCRSSKDKQDIYYHLANDEGKKAIWVNFSGHSSLEKSEEVKIVVVDPQAMVPLPGVTQIQGDIIKVTGELHVHFEGQPADLVMFDGAPDVMGLHDVDEYVQVQLIFAALNMTKPVLNPEGTFVAMIFCGKDVTLLKSQLTIFFNVLDRTYHLQIKSHPIQCYLGVVNSPDCHLINSYLQLKSEVYIHLGWSH